MQNTSNIVGINIISLILDMYTLNISDHTDSASHTDNPHNDHNDHNDNSCNQQ